MGRLRSELENKVALFRQARGLTQEQLAQAVEVSRQTIVAIEGGSYCPSTVLALRLSLILAVPVNDLFTLPELAAKDLVERRERLLKPTKER